MDVLRRMLRSADAVTACSHYLLNRAVILEPSISGKATVIHNGVEPSRFLEHAPHRHASPYVFAYGRHTHKKGFDLLLQAFAGVARRVPEVDLIVAGSGEETEALRKLCTVLGLEERVVFHGRATPEEIVRLLNGCRLAVIPSREEPFGIAAVEALFSGRPLVATRVGGLPEVAAAAASIGGSPGIYWSTPDALDLERTIMEALSESTACAPRASRFCGLSVSDMTRSYQRVLEGEPIPVEGIGHGVYAAVCP
jgi:glycosyltransferase involved in cell wall biosynthesis